MTEEPPVAPLARSIESFAEARSHRDAEASNETGRATAQAAILINGGAATAVLAYLSKDTLDAVTLRWVPLSLAGYGLGVLFGAVMLFFIKHALDAYNVRWRLIAFPTSGENEELQRRVAYARWLNAHRCFAASMFFFIASSLLMAWTLAHLPAAGSKPSQSPPAKNTPAANHP